MAAQGLPDGGQVAHHFHEAHHGQLRGGGENPHPLGGHLLAPYPEELRVGAKLPDGRHQPGGMVVPGGLPGDHEDAGGILWGRGQGAFRKWPLPPPPNPLPNPHKFFVYLAHIVKSFSEISQ